MVRFPFLIAAVSLCALMFLIASATTNAKAPEKSNDAERIGRGAETVVNPGSDVRIEVKVVRASVKFGEKGKKPAVIVELVNHGKGTVLIVKPGDGSSDGRRTPLISWYMDEKKLSGGLICGNINSLKPDEVLELKAGERLPLDVWVGVPPIEHMKAGVHHFYVEYDHRPDLKWGGIPLGKHDAKAMELIRNSKPIKAVSNVVEIRVEE